MTITLNALQKQRRDTASNWTSNNTVLLAGELGYETDTKKFKIGDGSTAWQSLDYLPIPDTNRLLAGNLTVGGNFTVNGTTTTIDTTTLTVEDKNIEIGKVSTPSDTTADGGGITLKGATDKTINWVDSTDSWTLSEHLDLASGKVVKVAGTQILSATQYTGNSATTTALATARTISGVSFDGTQNITLNNNAITNGAGYLTDLVSDSSPQLGGDLDTNSHNISLDDDHKVNFGDSNDLQIYFDGNEGYLLNQTSFLKIGCDQEIRLGKASLDRNYLRAFGDGSVQLFYDNTKRFETSNTGATVTGNLTSTKLLSSQSAGSAGLGFADNVQIHLGDSDDLKIYHSTSGYITNATGDLNIDNNASGGDVKIFTESDFEVYTADNSQAIKCNKDGATELHWGGGQTGTGKKFETTSTGAKISGTGADSVLKLETVTSGSPQINFNASGAGGHIIEFDRSDLALTFTTAGSSERMRIDMSGNLGIGSSSPTSPDGSNADNPLNGRVLTVYGDSPAINLTSSTTGSDDYSLINFGRTGSSSNPYRAVIGYKQSDDILRINAQNHIAFDAGGGINASEKMRIDGAGRLLLGSTDGATYSEDWADDFIVGSTANGKNDGITILSGTSQNGSLAFADSGGASRGLVGYVHNGDYLRFHTAATERMRIDSSGRLLIGTTTESASTGAGLAFFGNGAQILKATGSSDHDFLDFYRGTDGSMARVGNIRTTGSSTAYNTSSDYRLKENVTAISDGITRLKTLKPSRFNFIADATKTVDGFLAHEVTAVPEAITGIKDEIDSDNNPVYQGIDQSKLVPLLVAAVQELIGKVEALEAA